MIKEISAIVGLVGSLATGTYYVDSRYYHASEAAAILAQLDDVSTKLDVKITGDQLYQTQERIWVLEDRLNKNPSDVTTEESLRQLKINQYNLQNRLNTLQHVNGPLLTF